MDCDTTHGECKYFEEIAGSKIGVCINKEGQKFFDNNTTFYGNDSICNDGQPCPNFSPK
jgi:hypothetical protein